MLPAGLTKALDELRKAHVELNLHHSRYGYDAKAKEWVSIDFMNLVFKASNFSLLQYIVSSPRVISTEQLYSCQMDHNVDYDEMEHVGNVASLDPCSYGLLFKK